MKALKMKRLVAIVVMAAICLTSIFMAVTALAFAKGVTNSITETAVVENADLKIDSKEELIAFANRVNSGENFEGKLVVLTNDIDLENMAWTPIGYDSYGTSPENAVSFNGTFDGCGHTISNLTDTGYVPTIVTHGEYGFGLFGYAYGASFYNVKLANVNIHADDAAEVPDGEGGFKKVDGAGVAALVGYYRIKNGSSFVIENCHLESGSIYATNNMGGLVGYMYAFAPASENYTINFDGKIIGCTNNATVTTKMREAGGIIGLVDFAAEKTNDNEGAYVKVKGDLLFKNCKNYGAITAEAGANPSCAGGILGRDNTGALWTFGGRIIFDSCYNNGKITAYGNGSTDSRNPNEIHSSGIGTVFNIGGMTAVVRNCQNEGEVTVVKREGENLYYDIFCGEILACSGYAMIEHCVVTDYSKLYGAVTRMLFVEQPGVEINNNARALLYLNGAVAPEILTFGEKGGQAEENIVHKDNGFFDGWYNNPEFTGESVLFNNGGNDKGVFYAKFITLEEMYENTNEKGTITFESNVTGSGLTIDKDITIDLAGYTYTIGQVSTYRMRAAALSGLQIAENVNVTIKNGTIASETASSLIENYANLTLENVTLSNPNSMAISNLGGKTEIKDSNVFGQINVGAGSFTIDNESFSELGNYARINEEVFKIDDYAFSLTTDKTALKADEELTVSVCIDKNFYSAEYTFTYDNDMFTCAADLDDDGIIYVSNLFNGKSGVLASYKLIAKNNLQNVSTSAFAVTGSVVQYLEQSLSTVKNPVADGSAEVQVSLNYTVSIKADYVLGYSLVLVSGTDAGYKYNGQKMFYVEAYGAYAYIVKGVVTAEEVDAVISKTTDCEVISASYNVNAEYVTDGIVDLKDATAVYACFTGGFAAESYMELFLRADVNGDKVVNIVDVNAVTKNYTK